MFGCWVEWGTLCLRPYPLPLYLPSPSLSPCLGWWSEFLGGHFWRLLGLKGVFFPLPLPLLPLSTMPAWNLEEEDGVGGPSPSWRCLQCGLLSPGLYTSQALALYHHTHKPYPIPLGHLHGEDGSISGLPRSLLFLCLGGRHLPPVGDLFPFPLYPSPSPGEAVTLTPLMPLSLSMPLSPPGRNLPPPLTIWD